MEILSKTWQEHVYRDLPLNITERDVPLFERELHKLISVAPVFKTRRSFFYNDILFRQSLVPYVKQSYPYGLSYKHTIKSVLCLLRDARNAISISKPVLHITDDWTAGYYHWLIEALPRALFLSKFTSSRVVLLPPILFDPGYVKESLHYLRLGYIQQSRNQPLELNECITGSRVSHTGNFYYGQFTALRCSLFKAFKAAPTLLRQSSLPIAERLWISRSKAARRRLVNEDEVVDYLRPYGFQSICLEDYSFLQQTYLCSSATVIAGVHGAGLANMVSMQPGSVVLEVRFEDDNENNCFFSLASILRHHYLYVKASFSLTLDTQVPDMYLEIEELKSALVILGQLSL